MTDQQWTTEELLAFAAGDMTPEQSQQLERRIASDAEALRLVGRYRAVADAVHRDDTVQPSATTVKAIHAYFEQFHRQRAATTALPRPAWLDRLHALVGELLFDSRLQPIALRRRHAAEFIQLAYRVGDGEIDVRATWSENPAVAGAGQWRVLGQITRDDAAHDTPGTPDGTPPETREVALVVAGSDAVVVQSACDETGMFALDAKPGAYDLCIRMVEGAGEAGLPRLVVLPGIDLP